jgi:predicted nucleic acid-binding protein
MLLRLGETGAITLLVSPQVLEELNASLSRKAPDSLPLVAVLLDRAQIEIVAAPDDDHLARARRMISHAGDAAVLAAAWQTSPDFFATLDRQHFLDKPRLAAGLPFPLGTPGDALSWIRTRFLDASRGPGG